MIQGEFEDGIRNSGITRITTNGHLYGLCNVRVIVIVIVIVIFVIVIFKQGVHSVKLIFSGALNKHTIDTYNN